MVTLLLSLSVLCTTLLPRAGASGMLGQQTITVDQVKRHISRKGVDTVLFNPSLSPAAVSCVFSYAASGATPQSNYYTSHATLVAPARVYGVARPIEININVKMPNSMFSHVAGPSGFVSSSYLGGKNTLKTAFFTDDLAYATGSVKDVLHGQLLCFPSDFLPKHVAILDALHGVHTRPHVPGGFLGSFVTGPSGVSRGVVQAMLADGTTKSAYLFYQAGLGGSPPKASSAAAGATVSRALPGPVAIFGCTGGSGRAILEKLVSAKVQVRCLLRNVTKLRQLAPSIASSPYLTLIPGDARDEALVKETVRGAGAVVVALGGNTSSVQALSVLGKVRIGSETKICSQSQPIINRAVNELCANARMVVITALGVGSSYQYASLATKAIVNTLLREAVKDKNIQEEMVRHQIKNYVIVRPVIGLNYKAGTGRVKAALDISGGDIPRADLADFVVTEALGSDRWKGQAVTVAAET